MRTHQYFSHSWQVAAFASELTPGRLLARRIEERALVIYRTGDGTPIAMEDRCPHRSAPLSRGVVVGDTLRCGYHGLRFARDGRCMEIPGQDAIPPNARAITFPLAEKWKLIWIWMGDPAAARADLIPDAHWLDDANWVAAEGYHLVNAHYQLLTDNLLDLSHETYLHTRTIGNEAVAESPVQMSSDAKEVRVLKEIAECAPPPFYQYLARVPASARVRRWQRTTFQPPGFTVIDVGVEALDEIPGSNRVEGRVINLVTPATATTSHYFWAFARNFRLDESAVTDFLRENVGRTFDEDKEMLEAQQLNLGEGETDPRYKLAAKIDAAPIQGRRLLKAMTRETQQDSTSAASG